MSEQSVFGVMRSLVCSKFLGIDAPIGIGVDISEFGHFHPLAMSCGMAHAYPVSAMRCSHRRPVRLLRLPPALFAGILKLLRAARIKRGLTSEMVRRQSRDLVFDDREFRQTLDWKPRPFMLSASDFEIPHSSEKLRLPQQGG